MIRLGMGIALVCIGCGDSGEGGNGPGGSSAGGSSAGGSAPAAAPIECETEACDECCLNGECASVDACEAVGESAIVLFCDGPEDCDGGDTCCAGLPAGGSFPIVASCTAPAQCENQGVGSLYLCHDEADCGETVGCSPWIDAPYLN
jgi:hypothetical protein